MNITCIITNNIMKFFFYIHMDIFKLPIINKFTFDHIILNNFKTFNYIITNFCRYYFFKLKHFYMY